MKKVVILLLLMTCAASAQWSDTIDTITTGNFNDINPQVDHAGLGFPFITGYKTVLPSAWVVFERWGGNYDAIVALKYDATTSKWDTSVVTIAGEDSGIVRKYPDICTVKNGVSIAAWQQKSDSVWNIYYSLGNISSDLWSTPSPLTMDSVSNTNVEVRPLSDSSMALIWKRGNAFLYSIYNSGGFSATRTLTFTNSGNSEFDFDGSYFVWTVQNLAGNMFCAESAVKDSAGLHISPPDSIGADGSITDPSFTIDNGELGKTFTFNVSANGKRSSWWYYYYGINGWVTAELAGGANADYIFARQLSYPQLTASTKSPKFTVQTSYFNWMVTAEKIAASDTSIVFFGDSPDSILPGSDPLISPLAFVVWQSDKSGPFHLYSRGYTFVSTPVDQRSAQPSSFGLSQNYPNPFNPATNIEFRIANFGFVSMKVYDVLGRLVATLVNGVRSPGSYEVQFNGSMFASGVYFYRLTAPGVTIVKKMLLEK